MHKQKLYKIHRFLSVLIGIPVFFWALSGLLHPLMTSVRPSMATQTPPSDTLPTVVLRSALRPVLEQAHLTKFYSCQVIKIEGDWYYQIQTTPTAIPVYRDVKSGKELPDGDQLYAQSLARHFLSAAAPAPKVKAIKYIVAFTPEYAYVNRILPVYEVQFDRADSIRMYVSTLKGQFSFAEDNHRKIFNRFFAFFHTWSWLDSFPQTKAVIIACILLLTLCTVILGLYFAFTTKAKTKKGNRLLAARKIHRLTALLAAFFIMAWASSGVIHAIAKSQKDNISGHIIAPEQIKTAFLPVNTAAIFDSLLAGQPQLYTGKEYISIEGQPYLRLSFQRNNRTKKKDLMKDMRVSSPFMRYINLANNSLLDRGDKYYALWLAQQYLQDTSLRWNSPVIKQLFAFDASYNFSDKILPVWNINPDKKLIHSIFIDTRSRQIAKQGSRFAQVDAYAFAFFHKHEFMAWAGKRAKDTSTIIGVLLVLTMLLFGYRLYFISLKKGRKK